MANAMFAPFASQLARCRIIATALLLAPMVAQAQETAASINPALAGRGKSLFTSRGCTGCHTVGKGKSAGPDLAGVTTRRTADWLKQWLKAPESMFDSDSTAKALLAAAKGTKMPNMHLNDADIEALISYLAQAGEKH
jgi:cytochrome c2